MSTFFETVERVFYDWHYDHPRILYALIRALKPQVVVEVGSYRGYCAVYMARALQENNTGKLYCIDNWTLTEHVARYGDPRGHFEKNMELCGVRDWIDVIQGNSDQIQWPSNVDFCYVDGWHGYLMARHDFEKAASLGASVIAMDDTENCVGPRLFSDEGVLGWQQIHLGSDNGLDIFVKLKPKRPVCFSQELPFSNPGVSLRLLSKEDQDRHFQAASRITRINYDSIASVTEQKCES